MSPGNAAFGLRYSLLQRVLSAIFRIVNIFVSWDRLPTLIGAVNIAVLRDRLRRDNLHHTGYGVQAATPWVAGNEHWRSADGSYNSLDYPRMGMAGSRFARNVPLSEAVPDSGAALLDPNPRVISRELLARKTFMPATTLNLLAAAWIHFETQDWFAHGWPIENDTDPHQLKLPPGDDWPDAIDGCMHIPRTRPDPTPREPWLGHTPTFINQNSHWWDAAQLYGSDRKRQERIRSGTDGMIRLGSDGMLPDDETNPGIDFTGFNDNWWIGLSLLHNLFAREHNSICAALKNEYSAWDDEELFQRARLINAALIAKIHTVEWTPGILGHPALDFGIHAIWAGIPSRVLRDVLGPDSDVVYGIPGSATDQDGDPCAMSEEFCAVHRMHSLLPDDILVRSLTESEETTYPFLEVQGKFSRGLMREHGFADLLYSFGTQHPGAITIGNYPNFLRKFQKLNEPIMDMAAIDIVRDRERGVPRYNRFRELIGKKPVKSFEEITSKPGVADKLRRIYNGDVGRVDLLVGTLSEDLPQGCGISDTAFRVFILMASRRLKSDRFFTSDYRPAIYTELGMDWINSNSMKSVLLRHVPQLAPSLEGVANAFAPWNKLQ